MDLTGSETLLLADDEAAITDPLLTTLTRHGYKVLVARDGDEALQQARHSHPQVVILDIEMPKRDGFDVCRSLRREGIDTPIIMLTKITNTLSKLGSFEEGADDYIIKPFDEIELLARIRVVLRNKTGRINMRTATVLAADDIILDRRSRTVSVKGNAINLGEKAIKLLDTLMVNYGFYLSHGELLRKVWGIDMSMHTMEDDSFRESYLENRVRRQVVTLRDQLNDPRDKPKFIETRKGYGYRFIPKVDIR